jgi:hypothetical protein
MRRRTIIITAAVVSVILIIAAFTKPDDKQIKIEVVDAIWGKKQPDKYKAAQYYEEFMNLTTQDIDIDDWLFLKRIQYTLHDTATTIGFAAFGKIMLHK